ncbi:TPA: hypothetical protein I9Z65_000517 [Clostridium perfringens]|nr:hypothetical protein [Clostridium perfringens]HBC2032333.1 hypothetical protein [Clostridium perfringens]HBC2056068.1 hypothetical protein [Clostridium perfringens]HBC2069683.1 hypothetical protein [Clostridium perfringens]
MAIKIIKGFCPTQNSEATISATIVKNPTFENPNDFEVGTIECSYASTNDCTLLNQNKCPLKNSIN